MKKTQRRDAWKNISKQKVSFLSIIIIAAMAVTAYLSLNFASRAIADNADRFYDATGFRDAEVISTLLLSEDDLNALRATEGVADVEAIWQTSGTLGKEGEKKNVTVRSLTERINTPLLLSGRLPETDGECVVDWEAADALSLGLGDEIRVEGAQYLKNESFSVCGIAKNGETATNEMDTPGDRIVIVLPSAFDMDELDGCCMKALLRYADSGVRNRFDSDFTAASEPVTQRVKALADPQAEKRTEAVLASSAQKIAEGEQELDEAKQELEDARKELDDGWTELADGETQADAALVRLDDAKAQLADALRQLESGELQLADGKEQLDAVRETLGGALYQLNNGQAQLDDAKAQLDDGRRQLDDGWTEYHENEALLADAKAQLDDGKAQLDDGQRQLDEAKAELEEAKRKLDDGEAAYEAAGKQLADGEAELDDGAAQLSSGRAELVSGAETIEGAKTAVRSALKSTLDYALGTDTSAWLSWAPDSSTLDVDAPAASATSFPIAAGITLDLNLSMAGNIASVLNQIVGAGLSETDLQTAVETVYGVIAVLPGDTFIGSAAQTIAATYATYDAGYTALATGAQDWDAGHAAYIAGAEALTAGAAALNAGKQKYKDARKELDEGWEQYNDGLAQYEAGLAEFSEKQETYAAGLAQYEEGAARLAEGLATLNEKEAEYADGLADYEAAKQTLDDGWAEYYAGLAQYQAAYAEYSVKLEEYNEGVSAYETGLTEYKAGEQEYADARKALENGKTELEDGERRYAEGMADYLRGTLQLADARQTLNDLNECSWVVLDMNGNSSYQSLSGAVQNCSDMGMTFALIFIIVGALVIYATLGRIVEEQRRLVGATKALGLYKREIFAKYLIFGVGATLLGIVLGIALAYFFIQPIIVSGYSSFYNFDNSAKAFILRMTLIVLVCGVALATLAVWSACRELLRTTATGLMQEKTPNARQAGGRWTRKLSLYARLIVRNILTDKKRIAVTIISVAGCCALLTTGFTMRRGILEAVERQFDRITRYDYAVTFSGDADGDAIPSARSALEALGTSTAAIRMETQIYSIGGNLSGGVLFCGDLEEMQPFVSRLDAATLDNLPTQPEGIWLSFKIAEVNGLAAGDSVTLYDGAMRPHSATIAGVFDDFVRMDLVMSRESYAAVFGAQPQDNTVLVLLNGAEAAQAEQTISSARGVANVEKSADLKQQIYDITAILDLISMLMVGIAAVMACFILLNLISMHISQKKRELTIMRVNGFTTREVIAYIVRETVVTNLIGILLGNAAGIYIGYRTLRLIEGHTARFVRSVQPMALLIAALITAGFSVVLNVIALRKIKYLKLTDVA